MFAPVCSRFTTYAVPLDPASQAYVDAIMRLPAMVEWGRLAAAELAGVPMVEEPMVTAVAEEPATPPPIGRRAGRGDSAATDARTGPAATTTSPRADRTARARGGASAGHGNTPDPALAPACCHADRAAGRAAPGSATHPLDRDGQAHRGRNSATTLR